MNAVYLILLVLSAFCFALSAFGKGRSDNPVSLLSLGLLFYVLVPLGQTFQALGD